VNAETVEFHPEAAREAQAATEWYLLRSVRAAERFVRELEKAVGAIARAPDRWPYYVESTRRFLLRRFPYSVVYRVKGNSLQIAAIAHVRRRPGYWRQRLG
jgi:toxin ParE1/3/4